MPPTRMTRLVLGAILVVFAAMAFWPGLSGDFLFDDYPNILERTQIHATRLDPASLAGAAGAYEGVIGRPLATLSFAVDHVFWGLNPWGYKLTGLLVHLLNAMLVMALATSLLRLVKWREDHVVAVAFAIAAAWAVHPLQVSTVLYVVQRMETLCTTFILCALICYLIGRRRQAEGRSGAAWIAACVPLGVLALLSKETAILLPLYALAAELTVLGFAAATPAATRRWKLAYAGGAVLAIAALAIVVPPAIPEAAFAGRDFDGTERVLTQMRVVPTYLQWILVPRLDSYLFYYDDFAPSRGWLQPATTLAGAVLLLALFVAAIALRRRRPLAALGMLWFLAAHVLTSSPVPLELVFEHRNYFAMLGVLLVVADLARLLPTPSTPRVAPALVGIVLVGLGVLTAVRSAGWGDGLQLGMTLAALNPQSARASTDLGEQYMLRAAGDRGSPYHAMALREFERGSKLPNSSPMPEQGLIVLAAASGMPADPAWWDRMAHKLRTRPVGPQETAMIVGLLRKRFMGLEFDDRRFAEAYVAMLERTSMPAASYFSFAEHALVYAKDEALADRLYAEGVRRAHGRRELVASVAQGLHEAGHERQAQLIVRLARELGIVEIELWDPSATPAVPETGRPST